MYQITNNTMTNTTTTNSILPNSVDTIMEDFLSTLNGGNKITPWVKLSKFKPVVKALVAKNTTDVTQLEITDWELVNVEGTYEVQFSLQGVEDEEGNPAYYALCGAMFEIYLEENAVTDFEYLNKLDKIDLVWGYVFEDSTSWDRVEV